jgi:CHAD domain-containing protein
MAPKPKRNTKRRRVAESIKLMAGRQASALASRLEPKTEVIPLKTVHATRTDIKKLRAFLRLIREAVGETFYHRQNAVLRAVARSLSPVRDAEVQLDTLRKVRKRHKIPEAEFSHLERSLAADHKNNLESFLKSRPEWTPKLHGALSEIVNLSLKNFKKSDLRRGIKNASRKFIKAGKKAVRRPDTENLHVWRKRTKDLFYQLSAIEELGEKFSAKAVARLKKLGKQLGDDHDFVMLEDKMKQANPHALKKVEKHIRSKQKKFRKDAFKTGRKLNVKG